MFSVAESDAWVVYVASMPHGHMQYSLNNLSRKRINVHRIMYTQIMYHKKCNLCNDH